MRRRAKPVPVDGQVALASFVAACAEAGIERRALRLRLSRVEDGWARPHHRALVRQALEPLLMADRARHFDLPDGDVVVVWRGPAEVALEQVRRFFGALAPDNATLLDVLDLPGDAARLLVSDPAPPPPPAPMEDDAPPLTLAMLAPIEQALTQADLARFARRRAVCRRGPDGCFTLAWEKRALAIGELAATLAPGHDLAADRWLFRRLARTLDRRMLALLAAPGELAGAPPFAFDLTIATILSPEFLRFDDALPSALRGQVRLDLAAPDVLADLAAFVFARDFACARGYRLTLHGLTPRLLALLSAERLGVDFLALDARGASESPAELPECERLILTHADTPAAVAWGASRGIIRFQGRAVSLSPSWRDAG